MFDMKYQSYFLYFKAAKITCRLLRRSYSHKLCSHVVSFHSEIFILSYRVPFKCEFHKRVKHQVFFPNEFVYSKVDIEVIPYGMMQERFEGPCGEADS